MSTITWRNVVGQSLADASRPLALAQQTFDNAFSKIGDVLKQQEASSAAAAGQVQEGNKQSYLDLVHAAKTPEQLAALQQSGELQAKKALLNPANLAAVRGADEQRAAALMEQTTKRLAFEDAQQERTLRPMLQGAQALAAQGKMDEFEALMKANPGLERWRGDLTAKAVEGQRGAIRFDREGKKFEWDEQAQGWKAADEAHKAALRPGALTLQNESILNQRSQRASAEQQRQESATRLTWTGEDRASDKAAAKVAAERAYLKESGNEFSEGVFTPNRIPELMKFMKDNKIGDTPFEQQAIIDRLGKYSNGLELEVDHPEQKGKKVKVRVPVPMARVLQAVGGSKDQLINDWNQGWANEVDNALTAQPNTAYIDKHGFARNRLADQYQEFLELQTKSRENPGRGGKK